MGFLFFKTCINELLAESLRGSETRKEESEGEETKVKRNVAIQSS